MKRALAALALIAGTASASAPDDPAAGMVATAVVPCVTIGSGDYLRIVDDRTLVLAPTRRKVWKNNLDQSCTGLDPDDVVLLQPFGRRLCAGDSFRGVDRTSHFPGPYCRLGTFTTYERSVSRR